jgi:hypothetical protein
MGAEPRVAGGLPDGAVELVVLAHEQRTACLSGQLAADTASISSQMRARLSIWTASMRPAARRAA